MFADDPLLAEVASGTIITVAEDVADDVSLDPEAGDWHFNLQANSDDAGAYFTADSQSNFNTNNENWQLAVLDPAGAVVFGPAGEGVAGVGGVGGSETGELEADPTATPDLATYGDSRGSTFGLPNVIDDIPQDFSVLRGTDPLPAAIGDSVMFSDGTPAPGVAVDLFSADEAGVRADYLRSEVTGAAGDYSFVVEAGCYALVFIAPDGEMFVGGGVYSEQPVCVVAGESVLDIDILLIAAGAGESLGDNVSYLDGTPAAGVQIDLFAATEDGVRTGFLDFTSTDANGIYGFDVAPGCYVVVFVAPAGEMFLGGNEYFEQSACLAAGESNDTLDATIDSGVGPDPATIGDSVTFEAGGGVDAVAVDLFAANGDGSRGAYLRSTATGSDGAYSFSAAAGCYVVVFIAPDGMAFVDTGQYNEQAFCVEAAEIKNDVDAVVVDPVQA